LFTWARVANAIVALYEQVLTVDRTGQWNANERWVTPQLALDELALIDRGFATLVEALDQSRLLLPSPAFTRDGETRGRSDGID
jgi:hypothetical protein